MWVAILITVFIFTVILLCATRPDPISPDDRDDPDELVKSTLGADQSNDDGGSNDGGGGDGSVGDDGNADGEAVEAEVEITWGHVFYAVSISCVGQHTVEPNTRLLMGVYTGWIFFVFLLATVYTADLAAILMSPAPIGKGTPDVTTIWDCQAVNCNFCVQKGAANDAYFTAESEVCLQSFFSSFFFSFGGRGLCNNLVFAACFCLYMLFTLLNV